MTGGVWRIIGTGTEVAIGIGTPLGNKRPSLYIERGTTIEILATFSSDGRAETFAGVLDLLIGRSGDPK